MRNSMEFGKSVSMLFFIRWEYSIFYADFPGENASYTFEDKKEANSSGVEKVLFTIMQ
ncbi:MAG: hypothetical protein ACOYBB_12005 [Blautia sp.]|jgi:hypothetical protein